MKILAGDREGAKAVQVSAYKVAQARELRELANSNHPLAAEARSASDAVFKGDIALTAAYRVVKQAKASSGRELLSAQIDADLLRQLKALASERKQLFRDMVEEMVVVYLMAARAADE